MSSKTGKSPISSKMEVASLSAVAARVKSPRILAAFASLYKHRAIEERSGSLRQRARLCSK